MINIKTNYFSYNLPENVIAQKPLDKIGNSKMLVLDKETGNVEHKHFSDITEYLEEGDILVINDTKVIPARLYGVKEETNALIEILMLKETDNFWECLVKPAKRVHIGTIINFGEGKLKAECIEEKEEGIRVFKFIYDGI